MPNNRIFNITQKQVASLLPPRSHDSHKGQFGTVTVVGGNNGMTGAALLAGRAALKLGAGCVHVGLLADNAPVVDMQQAELMLHSATELLRSLRIPEGNPLPIPLPHAGEGVKVKSMFNPTVLAIGCGMGHDMRSQKILHDVLKMDAILVIDADALNILAMRPDLRSMLSTRTAASVITPHPGEAARLLGITSKDVQAARPESARELAKRMNCSVLLKGAGSLCVTRDGKMWLNNTGNPGMSSPGMGDVLSGMVAAFIAQGLSTDNAMLLAVHLHGAAGDALAAQQASIGMTASEVTEWSRWLLNQWLK